MRRLVIATLVGTILVTGYVTCFTVAQSTPKPHRLPVAIVVTGPRTAALADRVATAPGAPFTVVRVRSRAAAVARIASRDVFAALAPTSAGLHLLSAPAAGRTTAQVIERRLPAVAGVTGRPLQVDVVRALAANDAAGNALDFATFPLLIFGVVVPILMTMVAAETPVRRRLAVVTGFAVVAGTSGILVTNVVLGALPGPFLALAGVATLVLLAMSLCTSALIGLVGPPGVVVAVAVFLVVGNAASGTLVAWELMPTVFRDVGPWLPPGAAQQALRNVAYFDGVQVGRPLAVLAGYAIAGVLAGLAVGGRRPAPQGVPSGPTPDASNRRARSAA